MNLSDNKLTISVDTEALQRELAMLREALNRPPATVELAVEPPTGLTGLALAAAVATGLPKKLTRRQLFGLR